MNEELKATVRAKYGEAATLDMTDEMLSLAAKLERAGFVDVTIVSTRVFEIEEARGTEARIMSAFIRASKPARRDR